jgi:hypothetical protein
MDQRTSTNKEPEFDRIAVIDDLAPDGLARTCDELSEELLELAVGAMRTVMPTYCWHKDGPHLTDWVSH